MRQTAELQLVLECCRRNFRGSTPRAIPDQIDWPLFGQLARFHRIEGLCRRALLGESAVPSAIMQNLTDAASRIAADNLRTAAESQLLSRVFEAANVPILFVKGLTLGRLAYGNPAIKSAVDGDVLIDPMDMSKAAACLENAGFKLIAPRHSLHRWHRSWKESVWYKSTTGVQIDLHTRLADNPRVIPGLSVHSPNQCVDIGSGITLPTLAEDELLTYLAVHGAAAGWFRLKWAADFAALLADRPANEVRHCLRRSPELGGGRTFGQALLLAHRLFSLLGAEPQLVGELESDRGICGPVGLALKLIQRAPAEPTELFLGTLPIHRSQFAMLPGIGYKLEEVRRRVAQSLTRVTTSGDAAFRGRRTAQAADEPPASPQKVLPSSARDP